MPTNYKKFSEVAVSDLATYLRLTEFSQGEEALLTTIIEAGKNFILTYTGRKIEEADKFPEFTIALYAIAEDMFDKRTYTVNSDTSNKVVDSILGSRSVNLL
jgi:hypothetical protein